MELAGTQYKEGRGDPHSQREGTKDSMSTEDRVFAAVLLLQTPLVQVKKPKKRVLRQRVRIAIKNAQGEEDDRRGQKLKKGKWSSVLFRNTLGRLSLEHHV